jgi:hypothetical protein
VPQPPIANDMAEGESIRALPTLNEPVIDQAHILSNEDKQAIGQKIRALHDTGKAQIGVVIVPPQVKRIFLVLPCVLQTNGSSVQQSRTTVC